MEEKVDVVIEDSRGTKRKAEEITTAAQAPKRIKALDQNVVNKIAAGEIIVAPVHALKELIENAVDAGSTSLEILAKDGGLKLLQITDNGHGINVEDLFYNVPSRQRAFRSPSEEYAKILDVVGRYAVHCTGVAFSCKKHGDSAMSISTPANATTVDCIRQIHGSTVANELIEFAVSDARWGFSASGWTSNANYHVKKTTLLLFINHRSVESSAIKKAIEQAYSAFLPKGGHPFVYLSLDVDPQRVDVNVHPTKREVNFLNEDEIIESICQEIKLKLSLVDTSRTFTTQSLLPGAKTPMAMVPKTPTNARKVSRKQSSSAYTRPVENTFVRTDPNLRKITSMLSHSRNDLSQAPTIEYMFTPREPTQCRLATIKQLRAAVRDALHSSLTEVFATHTYVGLIDPCRRIAAIQGGVKLFLVDYGMICNEYFYQLGLTDFGNFGVMRFDPPLDIRSLVKIGVSSERAEDGAENGTEDIGWEEIPDEVTAQLVDRRDMLLEYFQMEISESGDLLSIPLLLKGFTPSLIKLPRFLMRLGPCVNWREEKTCFHTFLKELAAFYTPQRIVRETKEDKQEVPEQSENNGQQDQTSSEVEMARVLEHVLFPSIKARFIATHGLLKGVVEVANLKGLYKNPGPAMLEKVVLRGSRKLGPPVLLPECTAKLVSIFDRPSTLSRPLNDRQVALSVSRKMSSTATQTQTITAENITRLFPEVNTSLASSHKTPTTDSDLQGYDEEQIRLMEEVCIVLDNDDNPIGSASKKVCHLMKNIDEGLLHRAFSVFLFDSQNRLLLQQRASEKITFPDMWTNTCCSHPLGVPEETGAELEAAVQGVRRAAQRKLDQELGIKAKQVPLANFQFLTRIHYKAPSDGKWGEHEIDYILIIKSDVDHQANPNEVKDTEYVTQQDLRRMFENKSLKFTPWFKLICNTMLFEWWDHLDQGLDKYKGETEIRRM
ncbi:MAG: hypothetical protein Q9207_003779 [Kuettlingeria erythrocarpa]